MTWYKNTLLNRFFGKLIKLFSITIPQIMQKNFVQKWRVSGIRNIKLQDGISFNFYSNWDDHIADQLFYGPRYYSEINELNLFIELAAKSDIILDIGANTGLYSICSSKKNKNAKIFSFEPYPVNAERFKKNIALNSLEQIQIIEKALGNENREVAFAVPKNGQICDALSVDQEFTKGFYKGQIEYDEKIVEQITLDGFVEANQINKIDLIKIDVENYEIPVFQGAKRILSDFSPVILVEIFVNNDKIDFYESFLKPLGYNCYIILSEGIVKMDSLVNNPDCRNYLFSKKENHHKYLSFKNMELLIMQLM